MSACTCPPGGVLRNASCPQHGVVSFLRRHGDDTDATAKIHRKVRFGIPESERREMLDTLLEIHRVAMATFDAIEADELSVADIWVMHQLPDYCNQFTRAIETHVRRRLG